MDGSAYKPPLHAIPRGTLIFDLKGRTLGTLDYIQTPDQRHSHSQPQISAGTDNRQQEWDFGDDILALVFKGDDMLGDDIRERMDASGYFHISTPNHSGYFVMGDQIQHEDAGVIYLNAEVHQLLAHYPQPG